MDNTQSSNALRLLQAATVFRARLSGELAAVHGLSVNDFLLLLQLDQAPAGRLSRVELARRLHLSASTVTRMAAPMEKIGLLARQAHDRDARLAFVVLTPAGQTKLQEAKDTFDRQSASLFSDRWSASELEELSGLLHRLVAGTPATPAA